MIRYVVEHIVRAAVVGCKADCVLLLCAVQDLVLDKMLQKKVGELSFATGGVQQMNYAIGSASSIGMPSVTVQNLGTT